MALSAISIYIFALKAQNTALISNNKVLTANNTQMKSVNDTQVIVINEMERERAAFERITLSREVVHQEIASSTIEVKQVLNTKLQESKNETDIVWADEPLPDIVISMLNSSRGGGANEVNTSDTTSDINTRLYHTYFFWEEEPRPG